MVCPRFPNPTHPTDRPRSSPNKKEGDRGYSFHDIWARCRDDGARPLLWSEILKVVLLALAASVALTTAGALLSIGMAHL
jgi:hypothetical protein